MVVTRHPELWSWLVWLPHNQHDEMFDACGLRRLLFASPTELEEALDAELHRKGRGPWAPPVGTSPSSMPSAMESLGTRIGPHFVANHLYRRVPMVPLCHREMGPAQAVGPKQVPPVASQNLIR